MDYERSNDSKSCELGDNKTEKKMVTITTTSPEEKEKTSNCVTPKKKPGAAATEAPEQTAPNILVYKKVRESGSVSIELVEKMQNFSDGSNC